MYLKGTISLVPGTIYSTLFLYLVPFSKGTMTYKYSYVNKNELL